GANQQPTLKASVANPHVLPATIPVGRHPESVVVAPNGSYAYVANSAENSISMINTTTATSASPIKVAAGMPQFVTFTPDGKHAYVRIHTEGMPAAQDVAIVDTTTNTVTGIIPTSRHPFNLAVTPHGDYVYVPDHDDPALSVIDISEKKVRHRV